MRNKVDLSSDPDLLFLNPWRDKGLKLLEPPSFVWREVGGALIDGFAVSAHAQINAKIRSVITHTKRQKQFTRTVEINTVPAVLEDASFRKSHVMVGERLVLSGASASRLFNAYRWENEQANRPPTETIDAFLAVCRKENAGRDLAVENTFIESDLDFAVECRNTFNYFHFMTESLCQLCVLDSLGFQGNIYFHFPNQTDKHRSFADAFVEALFPEYTGRVFFERAPKHYDLVLSAYDLVGAMAQMPEDSIEGLKGFAPKDSAVGSVDFQPVLAMNSVTTALLSLRKRALRAIEGRDCSHLPKRVFIGRSETHSRNRPLDGQDMLMEHLRPLGFKYAVFEDLQPLDQIALMAHAEMMVSPHGAGFTNMMFAAPDAYVIELGTLQTAQHRWADFWPMAHAAQCRYLSFFADFSTDNPLLEPDFGIDGIVPTALSTVAVSQISTFIAAVLGPVPAVSSIKNLNLLGKRTLRAGAVAQTIALLDYHNDMVLTDGALCLLRADCHKALDQPKSELVAIDQAYHADPKRWQTLVRMIWCANRCERPEVIRWALTRLAADFPERHDTFVANHDWVRFVA